MKKLFGGLFKTQKPKPIKLIITHLQTQQTLQCLPGDNLMDVTNRSVNADTNVYGLCDKQLACTTCSVEIESKYEHLKNPSEDELDILYGIPTYRPNCTRMACQITLDEKLDGMVVRIPRKGG